MAASLHDVLTHWSSDRWLNVLDDFVAGGGDPNAIDPSGRTLLQLAIEKGSLECCQYLVDRGAALDAKGTGGWSVLHHAVDMDIDCAIQNGWPVVMAWTRLLLRLGATECPDAKGRTPADIAAGYGDDALKHYRAALASMGR